MTEIRTSDQINEIAAAIAKAQAELGNVERGGTNPHFHSRYAQLGAVLDEVRPKFAKHGVAILQHAVNGVGSNVGVVTRLAHSSGQWIESSLYVAPARFDAQGAGSVISYLRRYALMSVAGIGPDDDDGEAAVGRPQEPGRQVPNGTTRVAVTPSAPVPPINVSLLSPGPEETPEMTASRQRIRILIDKYDHLIKTAPDAAVLTAAFDAGQQEIAEIEEAGDKGRDAARALRRKYTARMTRFGNREAA
jgi:ERF superfamily